MNKLYPVLTVLLSSLFCFQKIQAADKYIQSNSNWSTATWYDASSGGDAVSAPSDADNVFTNGFQLTVDGNFACNNLTVTNLSSAIIVNSTNTLTIHGTLTGPGSSGNDLVGGTGTIVLKKASDIVLSGWWNSTSFENIIFDPGTGNTVNLDPSGAWCYASSTGKITIASGTLNMSGAGGNTKLGSTVNGGGTLEIAEGATLTMGGASSIDAVGSTSSRVGTLNIYGTLIQNSGTVSAATFTIGTAGLFKPCVSWNFFGATPTTFTCNGTTEYAANGGQNIVAGHYNKLVLSGSGSKQLMGTTGIDQIHYMASSSCVTFNQNSQTVNIPSTGSGISPIAGTFIVSNTRQHDFYDLNDINQNMILRGVGDGGLTFKFTDGEIFNTYSGCPVKLTVSGTIDKPIVLTRTGSVGADNPPIIRTSRNGTDDCAIYVYNSSYYTFDGLSFDIDNTNYNINNLIKFVWNITGGGTAFKNTVQNCTFDMGNNTTLTSPGGEGIRNCILIDPAYSLHPTVVAINYDSTLIRNNIFKNCDKGMYLHGWAANQKVLRYTQVLNNEFINCQSYGIWFTSGEASKIIGNTIHATLNNNPNYTSYSAFTGISVTGNSGKCYIIKNKIFDIANTNTAAQLTGIYVQENDSAFIINNMVYDLHAESATISLATFLTGSVNELGIYTQNTGKYLIEHNTVYLSHQNVADGNKCCAFKSWNVGTYHLNNNIFIADVKPYGNNTYNACKFYFNTNPFPTNDYNLYFAGDSMNANNYIGVNWNSSSSLAGSKQRFFRDFKPFWTAAGKESHSVTEYITPFINTTPGSMNVHLPLGLASLAIAGATPITTPYPIIDDIDGNLRSTTAPTMGADEGTRLAKYLHANATWNTPDVWYDAPTGENITTSPNFADDVFTNGHILTVDGNFECNDISITSNTTGAITVNESASLVIHGMLTGPGWVGNDLISGNGSIIFKKTSGTILSNWASSSTFENVIFDPGTGNTVNFSNTGAAWLWVSATGKATIASGTLVLAGAGHNVAIGSKPQETGTIEISQGATLDIQGMAVIGSPDGGNSDGFRMGNLNVYGTLLYSSNNFINVKDIYIGVNGIFNNTKTNFYNIEPSTFVCDGSIIGVDQFYPDRFIQNRVFTTQESLKGNKIKAGSNVTPKQDVGPVIIDNGSNVTLDGKTSVILDKGFKTTTGGTFLAK